MQKLKKMPMKAPMTKAPMLVKKKKVMPLKSAPANRSFPAQKMKRQPLATKRRYA